NDRKVWDTTDEFLFGSSILAAPILSPQYTEEKVIRENAMSGWDRKEATGDGVKNEGIDWTAAKQSTTYLPKGAQWYDFWTGTIMKGGQTVTLTTQLDRVPMFVRAGSILPLAPEMQYIGQQAWDDLEMRVYPGANGTFTLYEDEGDNYNYERGQYTEIPFSWNDAAKTLTIGQRRGQYKGMLQQRQFRIVLPNGTSKAVDYKGAEITVKM
ncbi:MAG: DUF5110 domain-containing protein, partial [Prevotella sp.]|nr:DUF5110 domain-containing protein [Prevotella sp.]